MKNLQSTRNLLFMLILMFLASVTMADEQKKTFHEEYDVNADAELTISNEYGKVVIESWDKNQVVIDIVITVEGKSESKAKEILDKIVIKDAADSFDEFVFPCNQWLDEAEDDGKIVRELKIQEEYFMDRLAAEMVRYKKSIITF